MRRFLLLSILMLTWVTETVRCAPFVVVIADPAGTAGGVGYPVSTAFDLRWMPSGATRAVGLRFTAPQTALGSPSASFPVQFQPELPGGTRGRLWWLLPPGERNGRYELTTSQPEPEATLSVKADDSKAYYDISEGSTLVLRYNHGTVSPPPGVPTNYARGDYIMPLYGPDGEKLADDYPKDHPHHRGVSWSWPVTRWGKEVRDIWAVQGVWSRPVAVRQIEAGPVFALLCVENVWKWGDTTPIVREDVRIQVFRRANYATESSTAKHSAGGEAQPVSAGYVVDTEVRLQALVEEVAIGGRPHGAYGGFGLRAMPSQQRTITRHIDPPDRQPQRSWLDYTGIFAGGRGAAGLTIFEHPDNPKYPNGLLEYPDLNFVMPAFPGDAEVPLSKDRPLILKHRLWIHVGRPTERDLDKAWEMYARPPKLSAAR